MKYLITFLKHCLAYFTQSGTPTYTSNQSHTPTYTTTAQSGDIIPARCKRTKESFGILLEYVNGKLLAYQGVRFSQLNGCGEVQYKNLVFKERIIRSSTFRCPICGNKNFVKCNKCGGFTCYNDSGLFRCAHCGRGGLVSGHIYSAHVMGCETNKDDQAAFKSDGGWHNGAQNRSAVDSSRDISNNSRSTASYIDQSESNF